MERNKPQACLHPGEGVQGIGGSRWLPRGLVIPAHCAQHYPRNFSQRADSSPLASLSDLRQATGSAHRKRVNLSIQGPLMSPPKHTDTHTRTHTHTHTHTHYDLIVLVFVVRISCLQVKRGRFADSRRDGDPLRVVVVEGRRQCRRD